MSLKGSITALVGSRPVYNQAGCYYEGVVDEVFASEKLRQLLGDTGRRYRINHARTPVDVMLERTEVNGIEAESDAVVAVIQQSWDDNQLGLEAKDVHRRAYEFGDSYLIGWEDEDLPGGVSLYAHDPRTVRVFYDPQRPRVKSHAIHLWLEDSETDEKGGRWRVNVYTTTEVQQWMSEGLATDAQGNVIIEPEDTKWVEWEDPEGKIPAVIPHDWRVVPVFHFRTDRPYGRPEHRDAYGPQDIINKVWSTIMALVDYHAGPQRYIQTESGLSGKRPPELGPEQIMAEQTGVPATEAQGLDDSSRLETGPSELWLLSGQGITVGEFSPADPNGLLSVQTEAIKEMAAVTDIAVSRFTRTGDAPSGESYRQEDKPLTDKVKDRQAIFGVTWTEVFEFILRVKGITTTTPPTVAWAPPTSYDDGDSWETANLQIEAGVPRAQVLKERAYSDDDIERWGVPDTYTAPQPVTIPAVAYDDGDNTDPAQAAGDEAQEATE